MPISSSPTGPTAANGAHQKQKYKLKLHTFPSETHTNWFCCCWIASLRAPYQPSFIEFKLIVAKNKKPVS